jgi:hypothetical protein
MTQLQPLVHREELLRLPLHHLRDGDARPAGDDGGDVLFLDLLAQEAAVLLEPLERRGRRGEVTVQLVQDAVAQLRRPAQIPLAFGDLRIPAGILDPLLQVADPADGVLLVLPDRLHRERFLAQLRESLLERREPVAGAGGIVLLERLLLDLGLQDLPLHLVDRGGKRVDLHLEARGCLVDEVDRLVRKETVGDVAVREDGGCDERGVGDLDSVVDLVPFLQAAQDRDRVLDRRLADGDRLEPALEGGVLLDVLAVLAERRGADGAQLPSRESGLEHVARVHRPLRRTGADEGVELVDEEDDLPLGLLDLLDHGFQPLLELPAVLRSREHRSQVEGDDLLVLQALGHVAGGDAPREPFDDGGLADARIADEDGVVLRPARQDLHDAADLVVPPDDGVELAAAGQLGQVASVALQRLVLLLGIRVVDAGAPPDLLQRGQERSLRDPVPFQDLGRLRPAVAQEGEEEMLERHVLVAKLPGDPLRRVEHLHERGGVARLGARPLDLREARDESSELGRDEPDRNADPRQERHPHRRLGDESGGQVLRRHFGLSKRPRVARDLLKQLLNLEGVAVGIHSSGLQPDSLILVSLCQVISYIVSVDLCLLRVSPVRGMRMACGEVYLPSK